MFTSIVDSASSTLTVTAALICTGVSVAMGLLIALSYMLSCKSYTKNFIVTLALLPVLVQGVIMMVSGNLGTSVAVLGTFSLVRFRSTPGTSREIATVFMAMAVGLATGMGQVAFAAMMTVLLCALLLLLSKTKFGEKSEREKILKILIPETLDYTDVFQDIFAQYTGKAELQAVKTTNLGSLYELKYDVCLKKGADEKAFLDALRCRNGNLNISLARPVATREEL